MLKKINLKLSNSNVTDDNDKKVYITCPNCDVSISQVER